MSYIPNTPSTALFSTVTPLSGGGSYTSSIYSTASFLKYQLNVNASHSGTVRVRFYSDAGGTDLVSEITEPYVVDPIGAVYLGSVAGPYVRFYFETVDPQTDFFFNGSLLKAAPGPDSSRLDQDLKDSTVAEVSRSVLIGRDDGGTYHNVPVDSHGHIEVALHAPLTAFKDLRIAELTPRIQEKFSYGIRPDKWRTSSQGNANVTSINGSAEVSCGTGANDFAILATRRRLAYYPGLGGLMRFTAAFPGSGVVNLRRAVGVGSVESGWFVGENPVDGAFGFLHRRGGLREIRTLTINAGASGAETATITLDGQVKNVPVTVGSPTFNASQIASADFTTVGSGWDVDQVGATVIFISRTAQSLNGAYSLVNGGGGQTIAGTFARTRAGTVATDSWTPQTAFSHDRLNGAGGKLNPSGFNLNKEKGNVYVLNWQYLGFGPQSLWVETYNDGNNATYSLAHEVSYLNANDYPSVVNPSAPFVIESRSLGSTTNRLVRSASCAGFVEGKIVETSTYPVISQVTANLGQTELPLFTLRAPNVFNDCASQVIIELGKLNISFKPQTSNYYATFRIRRNPTLTGGTNFAKHYSAGALLVDKTATGMSGGVIEYEITLTDSDTLSTELETLHMLLDPGDSLTFSVVASNGTTNIASMTTSYYEVQ